MVSVRQGEIVAVAAWCSAGRLLVVVVPHSVKGMQTRGGLASWHNVEQVVGALSFVVVGGSGSARV
jgi:hypothetical protein